MDKEQINKIEDFLEKRIKSNKNKIKRIKELKDQIDTLKRKIEIGQAVNLSKVRITKIRRRKEKA